MTVGPYPHRRGAHIVTITRFITLMHTDYSEPSILLATLAEFFSASGNAFRYVPLNKEPLQTVKFIKPILLLRWLTIAKFRKYTTMRLVVHGGNTHTYDGVKYDPLGWNLPYSNPHGYARTRYIFGFSDHIAQTYNTTTTPGILQGLLCFHFYSEVTQHSHLDTSMAC